MSEFRVPMFIHYVGSDHGGFENYIDVVARLGRFQEDDHTVLSMPMEHPACLKMIVNFHDCNLSFLDFVENNNLKFSYYVEMWYRDTAYAQWAMVLFVEFETDLIVFKMRE